MKLFKTAQGSFCGKTKDLLMDRSLSIEALVVNKNLQIEILAKMRETLKNLR